MKLTYDPLRNVGYIKLSAEDANVQTIKISDEVNIDMSTDGKLYGIELLNANEQLKHKNNIGFVIENIASKTSKELEF